MDEGSNEKTNGLSLTTTGIILATALMFARFVKKVSLREEISDNIYSSINNSKLILNLIYN